MKKFLINTPLKISWKANIGTLTKSDLSLSLENPTVIIPIDDFEMDDDKIVFNFGVEDQKYGGKYDAVLRDSSGDLVDVAAALDIIPNQANNTFGQNGIISVEPDYGGGSPGPTPTTGLKVIVSTANWSKIPNGGVACSTKAEAAETAGISEDDLDFLVAGATGAPCLFLAPTGGKTNTREYLCSVSRAVQEGVPSAYIYPPYAVFGEDLCLYITFDSEAYIIGGLGE